MNSKGLILMYHRIGKVSSDPWGVTVDPATFADHLQHIQRQYEAVTLKRVAAGGESDEMPRRWVVVTFDDGYADNLHEAKPLLERYGVPATVFAVSGKIGSTTEFWWDEVQKILLEPSSLPGTLTLIV